MQIKAEEISAIIKKQIENFGREVEVSETGTIISASDGIARIHGLDKAMAGELLEFPGNTMGMVLNLEEDNVGAAILGDAEHIKEGDIVKVKLLGFDDRGKTRLSMKVVDQQTGEDLEAKQRAEGDRSERQEAVGGE